MLQFWGTYIQILEGLIHGGAYFRNFMVSLRHFNSKLYGSDSVTK